MPTLVLCQCFACQFGTLNWLHCQVGAFLEVGSRVEGLTVPNKPRFFVKKAKDFDERKISFTRKVEF